MKNNETGRSMVEILGVLAVIGVLSVAGIYGYRLAMRRHRANEILKTASMLAVIAQSANSGEGGNIRLSTSNLPQNPGGVDVNMEACSTDGDTTVYVKINDSDCTELGEMTENASFIGQSGCADFVSCSEEE